MSSPSKLSRPATYDDLLKLPDSVVGEIVDGDLYTSPRPSAKHAIAASRLLSEIDGPFHSGKGGGPGGWWIIIEPELHLQGNVLVPDLAGWKKERMPKIPDVAFFDLAPDWVCEVLSPSNLRLDRVKKVPKYAEVGVNHLWLVDPIAQTLEVFRLKSPHWLLLQTFADKDKFRAEPFEAMEFDLSSLWGE
jgi:Uma2 family endonuclease